MTKREIWKYLREKYPDNSICVAEERWHFSSTGNDRTIKRVSLKKGKWVFGRGLAWDDVLKEIEEGL